MGDIANAAFVARFASAMPCWRTETERIPYPCGMKVCKRWGWYRYWCGVKYCHHSRSVKRFYPMTEWAPRTMNLRANACNNRNSGVLSTSSCEKAAHPCMKGALTPQGRRYIKVSDQPLYLHSHGGSRINFHQSLWTCPKANNYGNCQWVFEKSRHNGNFHYIKISDANLYMHAWGGSNKGTHATLHPCDPWTNYAHCQWDLRKEVKGKKHLNYLKISDKELYLCADKGSPEASWVRLWSWEAAWNKPHCQWQW